MRRSEQIEDLLNAIRNVDESKLQEVEKGFMKTVRAAARKIRVDEIREALRAAGFEHTKDNGKTLNILLGYPDLTDFPVDAIYSKYLMGEEQAGGVFPGWRE